MKIEGNKKRSQKDKEKKVMLLPVAQFSRSFSSGESPLARFSPRGSLPHQPYVWCWLWLAKQVSLASSDAQKVVRVSQNDCDQSRSHSATALPDCWSRRQLRHDKSHDRPEKRQKKSDESRRKSLNKIKCAFTLSSFITAFFHTQSSSSSKNSALRVSLQIGQETGLASSPGGTTTY